MKKIYAIILLFLIIFTVNAQNTLNIKGIVLDETKIGMPGVPIYLKDHAGIGTVTDVDGKFKIKATIGDKLVVSFMGYEKIEYIIKDTQQLEFNLKPKSKMMDEVVVVGLGTQRKVTSVGAISSVNMKELSVPTVSITNMLGGRIAGVITQQNSGEPGKDLAAFWIRGIGTFGANSGALVLIDGLEGNLNNVDPADVESFSILKDASATAVYGVRGANGVVLITTKRGQEGKLDITARYNTTLSHLTRMPQYLGAYDYAKLANEARVVRGDLPLYGPMELDLIKYHLDSDLYPDVNWQKEIMKRDAIRQSFYTSARGGGSVARYFLSLGASDASSAYKQDISSVYSANVSYKTYNYRANLDLNITKSTTVYFGSNAYLSLKTEPGNANTDYLWSAQSQLTPLTIPTVYSTGELPAFGPNDAYSPYVMLNRTGTSTYEDYTNSTTIAINQDLGSLIKGLKFKIQGSFDLASQFRETRFILPDMYSATGRSVDGTLKLVKKIDKQAATYSYSLSKYRKYNFESFLNYETIIRKDHRLTGLLYYYMSDQQDTREATSSFNAIPKRYQGVSGRVTYGFQDTYLTDLNFGYTGSENFEPGKQFGFFPSVAFGWIPTNYKIVKSVAPFLNFLKIRFSYGIVGNDRISNSRFPYLTLVNDNAPSGWGGIGGISESQIGANNLMWEKAIKKDLGLEGKLFNEKISFVIDFYNDKRDGIFQQRQLIPDYIGAITLPFGNVGSMVSWGSDGNISFYQKINKNSSFTLRGNFTYAKNKVIDFEQALQKYPYQNVVGWPWGTQRGYISLGLFKDEQDVASSPSQFGKVLPGDIKYKDVNADGKITSDDQIPLSYANYPNLMFGFGGEFTYKEFSIGVLMKGTGNTDYYSVGVWDGDLGRESGLGYIPFFQGALGNVLTIANNPSNRWIPASYSGDPSTENPNARFPRLSYGYNENNSKLSTFWKGNSQYLRLQEISLGYSLKSKFILKALRMSSVDIQLVGNNLLSFDNVKLWDPEQAYKNGLVYPIPAQMTLQVQANF